MSLSHLGEINLRKAEAAANEGDLKKARELYGKAIGAFGPQDLQAAQARLGVAAVFTELEQLEDAWSALSEATPVLERAGESGLHARALNQMGLIKRQQDALDEARELHTNARAVAARAGDLRQQAVALRNLAGIERVRGDLHRAVTLLTESADLQTAEGDGRSVALLWRQIRAVEVEAGRLERAQAAVARELALREELGEQAAVAATLFEGAQIARLTGRLDQAEAWLKRAAELRNATKDMHGACKVLCAAAALLLESRRPRAARRKLEAARDAVGEQGPVELRAELWRLFAETDLALLEDAVFDGDPLQWSEEEGLDPQTTTDEPMSEQRLKRRAGEEADEALALAEKTGDGAARAAALRTLARAKAVAGDRSAARERYRAAVDALEELREAPHELGGSFATFLSYGRWLSRQQPAKDGEARTAQDYLERAAILAEAGLKVQVSPDAATLARASLAQHHHRQGDADQARAQLKLARAHLGEPLEEPDSPRAALRAAVTRLGTQLDGDSLGSDRLIEAAEEAARKSLARLSPDELRDALYDLRRVQEISKALNSELELDRLLGLIIDVAIDLMGAERGFLILTGGEGDDVAFKVARNIERTEVERPDRKVSNTIARAVIEGGAPVSTGDATQDERFAGTSSVAEQRLRSVAAVPLRMQGKVTGALYVDHRYKGDLFGPLALELLASLADHAAIALGNARLVTENRRRAEALAAEKARLQGRVESQSQELEHVRARLKQKQREEGLRYGYENIVGRSAAMTKVFRLLDKVVASNIPVFIQGESGTGKELIARAIHYNGPRADGPFVSENFAAIVDELLESELFGHVKGSFTGAHDDKIGLFQRANGGTIFLDEVGDLSEKMQKELLRVLEEREVRPIGSTEVIPVDVRIVSATHQDLKQMVAEGTFRQDLFYRLHVLAVQLPPLRERREDIPLLVERFVHAFAETNDQPPKRFAQEALRKLMGHPWPGNVRELRNFVDRTALLCKGDVIRPEDVVLDGAEADPTDANADLSLSKWADAKEGFARRYLKSVLVRVGGNISLAARESGMLRQAFQRLLKRHGIDPNDYRPRK